MVFDLSDPERVRQHGYDHGGPLKLWYGPSRPAVGDHVIIKWPSYSQWAAVGSRSANQVEYWLVEVTESDVGSWLTTCRLVKGVAPGRKRKVVRELVAKCDELNAPRSRVTERGANPSERYFIPEMGEVWILRWTDGGAWVCRAITEAEEESGEEPGPPEWTDLASLEVQR